MLATLVDEPFSNPEWIFETKWDGFRSICFIRGGEARFVSRNQLEMTAQYPELASVAMQIDATEEDAQVFRDHVGNSFAFGFGQLLLRRLERG